MKMQVIKGQGAICNIPNHFEKNKYFKYNEEVEDENLSIITEFVDVFPKSIINEVKRKDMPVVYSLNPYQGCEHGCSYCYARPTHEFWGYSAGVDFERKIMVKKNAPELLEKLFQKKGYSAHSFMLSGNTDCYQPIERKLEITRKILQICLEYNHPVGIITKNALVLRDLDILKQLAKKNLVNVAISIPTMNESLRRKLEPRTSTIANKLSAVEVLAENNVPVMVMVAPVIPGLTSDEILPILKVISEKGAFDFSYTLLRLNDSVEPVFTNWLETHYPDRKEKVLNQIKSIHGGKLNERLASKRYVGEGNIAEMIHQTFRIGRQKYFAGLPERQKLNTLLFDGTKGSQLKLF